MAEDVVARFEKIEARPWGVEGATMELSKQVGELSKFILMREEYYFSDRAELDPHYLATDENIADEMADVLYAVIRIAKHYRIDLVEAHLAAFKKAEGFLASRGV